MVVTFAAWLASQLVTLLFMIAILMGHQRRVESQLKEIRSCLRRLAGQGEASWIHAEDQQQQQRREEEERRRNDLWSYP